MSFRAKRELLVQVAPRYRAARHGERSAILDEFIAVTGYDRKYAIRVLLGPIQPPDEPPEQGARLHRILQSHHGQAVQVDLPGKATPCLTSSIPASLTPGCTSRSNSSRDSPRPARRKGARSRCTGGGDSIVFSRRWTGRGRSLRPGQRSIHRDWEWRADSHAAAVEPDR